MSLNSNERLNSNSRCTVTTIRVRQISQQHVDQCTQFILVLYIHGQHLDPVVQSIVSLTISLRHKFVKQISAKVTNTLLFFVEKM